MAVNVIFVLKYKPMVSGKPPKVGKSELVTNILKICFLTREKKLILIFILF